MTTARSLSAAVLAVDPATDHARGPANAHVTLIEYGDFECPTCRQAQSTVKILMAQYRDQMRHVFRHFPLREVHPHAEVAAEVAEAAGAQHQFWPMHDMLFQHQQQLDEKHIRKFAEQIGLDMARFSNEITDHVYLQRVQEQMGGARLLNVRTTPTFYVNRELVDVSSGLDRLHKAVERALAA